VNSWTRVVRIDRPPSPAFLPKGSVAARVYVLEVKRSARRVSAAAGAWVRDRGPRRAFASKDDARAWARGCTDDRTVWVQDVPPDHGTDADGYLVARRVPSEHGESQRREGSPPGEQSPLADADATTDGTERTGDAGEPASAERTDAGGEPTRSGEADG